MNRTPAYEVQKGNWDAARPYAVVATFRSFNRIVGRYETFKQAQRRASFLSNRHEEARVREENDALRAQAVAARHLIINIG